MSFRNRTIIAGANGLVNLSVPLSGGRDQRVLSKDVKIDNTSNWRIRHIRTIISSYNRSPFFEYYRDSLQDLFSGKQEYLLDWNLECLEWLAAITGLDRIFLRSQEYLNTYPEEEVTDLRNWFSPKLVAAGNKSLLPYRQMFEDRFGFLRGLSVLDYVFCAGGNAVARAGFAQAGIDLNQ